MQTPVVSSFMGRESGGEQREWAQWGALAGSACSRGEERKGGGGGERQGGGRGDKGREERKIAQCKTDLSAPALKSASPAAYFLPLANWRLIPPAALLSPLSLLSGPHLSSLPSEQNATSKPHPQHGQVGAVSCANCRGLAVASWHAVEGSEALPRPSQKESCDELVISAWGHYEGWPHTWQCVPSTRGGLQPSANKGPHHGESARCPAGRSRKERYQRGGTQSLGFNLPDLFICVQKTCWHELPSHTHGPRPWHLVLALGYPAA